MGILGDILGAGINAGVGAIQNKQNRDWQANEAQKARDHATSERIAAQNWNLDMWNLQNEYNDPAAQMERMKNAGINPAAAAQGISGNGSESGSVQGSSPGSSPMASMPNQVDIGAALRQGASTFWQNRKLAVETEGLDIDNQYKPSMNAAALDKLTAETKKHFADIEGVRATTDNVRALTRQIQQLTPAQLKLLTAQTQDYIASVKLKGAQTRTEEEMPDLLEAQTNRTNAETDLTLNQSWTEKQKGVEAEYEALKAEFKKTLLDNGIMLGEHELDMVLAYAHMHDGNISGLVEPINRWNVGSTEDSWKRQTDWQYEQNKKDRKQKYISWGTSVLGALGGFALAGPLGSAIGTGLGPLITRFMYGGSRQVMNPTKLSSISQKNNPMNSNWYW